MILTLLIKSHKFQGNLWPLLSIIWSNKTSLTEMMLSDQLCFFVSICAQEQHPPQNSYYRPPKVTWFTNQHRTSKCILLLFGHLLFSFIVCHCFFRKSFTERVYYFSLGEIVCLIWMRPNVQGAWWERKSWAHGGWCFLVLLCLVDGGEYSFASVICNIHTQAQWTNTWTLY